MAPDCAQAEEHAVHGREARLDADGLAILLGKTAKLVIERHHGILEPDVGRLDVSVRNVEKHLLGRLDNFLGVLWGIRRKVGDLCGGIDHEAQGCVSVQHVGMMLPAGDGKRVLTKAGKGLDASGALELLV